MSAFVNKVLVVYDGLFLLLMSDNAWILEARRHQDLVDSPQARIQEIFADLRREKIGNIMSVVV